MRLRGRRSLAESAPTHSSFKAPWWPALLIVLLASVAYSNSFSCPFIFDDLYSIVENPSIRHLWPPGPVLAPPASCLTVVGRPLPNLTLAINYAFAGLEVLPDYHAVNLVIHILAGWTLYGVVRRTLLLPAIPASFAAVAPQLALAAAGLWVVHPLQTESVTYIIQRTESLMGLFYLLTLYCAIRSATAVSRGMERTWNSGACLACLCGMASKEVMVSAPIVVALYDRIFLYPTFRELWDRRWRLYAAMSSTWILLAVLVVHSAGRGDSAGFGRGVTSWQYLRTQFGWIVHYLHLTVWPHPLVLDYGDAIANTQAEIIPGALLVGILFAGTLAALRYQPWISFLGIWFFAILAPTSSFVPLYGQTAAEHRMYLPLAALCVLAVVGGWIVSQRLTRHWPGASRVAPALAACATLALASGTWRRNQDYESEQRIWDTVVRARPQNSRALVSRGVARMKVGQTDAAIADLESALRLDPHARFAHQTLGVAHRERGELQAALDDYAHVIASGQANAMTYNNRGLVYRDLGEWDEAIADYSRAIQLDPGSHLAYNNRAIVFQKRNDIAAAEADFSRAITLEPNAFLYRFNRSALYRETGRFAQALRDAEVAVHLAPRSSAALGLRAQIYEALRRPAAAIADYDRALELAPDVSEAWYGRARCQFALRHYHAARADLKEFIRLGGQPDSKFVEALSAAESP